MSTAIRSRSHSPASRPWKKHKSGVTPQLRALIENAGGQMAFARAVYGDAASAHKGGVAKWYYGGSGISITEARLVARKAEFPGVQRGRLSVDWLCGLSDEPNRDARTEVGLLPGALADHVAREVGKRIPRTGFWKSFVTYWRVDGKAIIAQAIERELECFRRASDGLDELAKSQRAIIEARIAKTFPPPWPVRGQSLEQRQAARREVERQQGSLAGMLVYELTHAEFVRRVNESEAAIIYDPELIDRQRAAVAKALAKAEAERETAAEKPAPAKRAPPARRRTP